VKETVVPENQKNKTCFSIWKDSFFY